MHFISLNLKLICYKTRTGWPQPHLTNSLATPLTVSPLLLPPSIVRHDSSPNGPLFTTVKKKKSPVCNGDLPIGKIGQEKVRTGFSFVAQYMQSYTVL